jgi:hypothetical protein
VADWRWASDPTPDRQQSQSIPAAQYLTNLLSNAAKFTESGGVMILCKTANIAERNAPGGRSLTSVLLGVADSGPGIHPSAQEHVLKAFTTGNAVPREVGRDLTAWLLSNRRFWRSHWFVVARACARVVSRCLGSLPRQPVRCVSPSSSPVCSKAGP